MRILLLALLAFHGVSADAQIEKFIQVSYGGGITNFRTVTYLGTSTHTNIQTKPFEINLGLQRKNFLFSVGVGTLKTGTKELLSFENPAGPTPGTPNFVYHWYTEDYRHLILPVSLGYQYKVTKKLSLVPTLGFVLAYNLSMHTEIEDYSLRHKVPDGDFRKQFESMSVFGTGKVNAEYRLTKQLSLSAGPKCYYMLTNMLIVPDGAPHKATQHNYALVFDVGVKWNLPHAEVKKAEIKLPQ